ncbi:MAG TPA: helix-turn-helix domain-containing protein [Longimicrobium sp.]|nr:helix-turn-helix domain-containing protein [Longimicrobium sp.]
MRDEEFQVLLQGVKEMVEHYHGLRHDLRTTILPMPPEPMDPAVIRALRERIGTSQAVFAMALNVSTKTVQAWESGARTPDGGNLKLLRVAEAHPEAVFGRLYQPQAEPERAPARPPRKPRAPRKPRPSAKAA